LPICAILTTAGVCRKKRDHISAKHCGRIILHDGGSASRLVLTVLCNIVTLHTPVSVFTIKKVISAGVSGKS
jgi:hypothetical protein